MSPKRVFIIPYRDREAHKAIFLSHMKVILKDDIDYEMVFVHQKDKREFNRGALKNIGFIYCKKTYPNDWKDITFIFHDIDCVPFKRLFDYNTTKGVVTHFYGFKFCFGGIFGIKGEDYEKINGFPNLWGWGFEDNKIKVEWDKIGGKINYDQFIFFTDKRVVKFDSSIANHDLRTINKNNLKYANNEPKEKSGYHTIRNLNYNIEDIESNIKMIHVTSFLTERREKNQTFVKNVTSKMIREDRERRQYLENQRKQSKRTFGMNMIFK